MTGWTLEGFNLASLDESVLYRIAKALEGVLEFKKEFARDPEAWRKQGRQDVDSGIDIWGVKWLQRNRGEAPENPMWGWAFAYDRDGGYLPESWELVRYLEEHGEYHQDGYVVKLGGSKGRLLQLSRGNRDSG